MKRKLFLLTVCAALVMCACSNKAEAKTEMVAVDNLYAIDTRVIEFEESTDVVVVEAKSGQMYGFYGIEDWEIDDRCVLIMDNNGTDDVKDDRIIRAIYRR